jgi:N-acetylglucosamine-6-sulfatase
MYSQSDPHQVHNLLDLEHADRANTFSISSRPLTQIAPRLDALVLVLKSCSGAVCTAPWTVLHPEGDVHSLVDSLEPRFDAFYAQQPKVSFAKCELGYIREQEGPQEARSFRSEEAYGPREKGAPSFRYQGQFGWWT